MSNPETPGGTTSGAQPPPAPPEAEFPFGENPLGSPSGYVAPADDTPEPGEEVPIAGDSFDESSVGEVDTGIVNLDSEGDGSPGPLEPQPFVPADMPADERDP